ncbi:unnamed protein product [Phytomonas sp. EM1]|nr:unnamed protein product [Phytomonas sp. EM1]|eukprot:CCW64144.1 unnamed protein product [Phytomonas sp. isolate EM1]
MASFTPLESMKDLPKSVLLRGRGHAAREAPQPVGVVIDRSCRVYISQIPVESIEREGANALRREFEAFGPIESYKMFTERSGRFIGSALCTYRNPADAALAIDAMNGRVIAETTLRVALSNEHGVMLLHPSHHRGFIPPKRDAEGAEDHPDSQPDRAEDDKWHHDKYQLLSEGKEMEEVLGIRQYRRGRGGFRDRRRGGLPLTRGERIDQEFEKYIAERDRELGGEEEKPYEEDVAPANEEPPTASAEDEKETPPPEKDLAQ